MKRQHEFTEKGVMSKYVTLSTGVNSVMASLFRRIEMPICV